MLQEIWHVMTGINHFGRIFFDDVALQLRTHGCFIDFEPKLVIINVCILSSSGGPARFAEKCDH